MAMEQFLEQASKLTGGDSSSATWCQLAAPIPTPPHEAHQASGKRRLTQRSKPLAYVVTGCATILFSPLLLLAALDGMTPQQIKERKRKKKTVRARKAEFPQMGLDRAFDGNWNAAAGQFLLTWYSQAPDPERLIVPMNDKITLLAAPSRWWYRGRPKRLRIVAEFPTDLARCRIPEFADDDIRRFWLQFSDGSWISLKAERGEQTQRFFTACRAQLTQ
ncbi:hypothetical protein [Streptomyces rhizosphaericus]|uniref:Uncharacterized protein n=1 Tax=Streptomyces rhizosphaericus TaxID=114699 RepID=A0A6G4AQ85_9ACTN|nr:hypothetical protein [Streptomyces rhizosphaericus]NEW75412.1 hypothetical protein [Streptomyces rhizosphaericus]